jgi:hypothetical protein
MFDVKLIFGAENFIYSSLFAGVFNNDGPYDQFIDTTGIPELTSISTSPFSLGAGVALSDFIAALEAQALANPMSYGYCQQMANHIRKVQHG